MSKTQQFLNAANKTTAKEVPEIPLDNATRRLVLSALKRPDVLITSDNPVNDNNDEGQYKLVDTKGNVLFELLISPFTIRLLQQGKIVARCNIKPIRGEIYDDIEITDDNMEHITFEIIRLYDLHHSKTKRLNLTTNKQR